MKKGSIVASTVIGLIIMGFFSKKPKPKNKAAWPLSPPEHAQDRHFQMNEYSAFGIYQFIAKVQDQEGENTGFYMYTVVLMENGYGNRYANILKNGMLTTDGQLLRLTPEWRLVIQPWLENKTDNIPMQDGIIAAELATSVLKMSKRLGQNPE